MPKKQKKFADDGWAIWVDGDDISTVYINNWLNPKSKSFKICGKCIAFRCGKGDVF